MNGIRNQRMLGELVKPRKEKATPSEYPDRPFIGLEHIEAHTMRLIGSVLASDMRSTAKRFYSGDVLYSRLRPYLNKVWCADRDGLCSSEFIVIPGNEMIDSHFLCYRLNSHDFVSFASQLNTGDRPRVDFDQISSFQIWFPKGLEDQRQIVADVEKQLTHLDAGVVGLKRIQVNLKRYRVAVLKAACEGRLVPTEAELARKEGRDYETGEQLLARILDERRKNSQGRGKCKEPPVPDTSKLPSLPEGWMWATMPQLGELNRGKSKHRPRDDVRLYGGIYPFIQTGDIRKSGGAIREYSQTYSEFGLQQSRLWPVGTLCITIAANIAETGILKFQACFPDSVVGFVQDVNSTITRYVEYFLRTAKEDLERYAPATAQKNINLNVLQNVAIALPSLAEQERIVAEVDRRLSVAEELEGVVSANLQRASRLRQSILKEAFAGEVGSK